jgi:hypothetical protein
MVSQLAVSVNVTVSVTVPESAAMEAVELTVPQSSSTLAVVDAGALEYAA